MISQHIPRSVIWLVAAEVTDRPKTLISRPRSPSPSSSSSPSPSPSSSSWSSPGQDSDHGWARLVKPRRTQGRRSRILWTRRNFAIRTASSTLLLYRYRHYHHHHYHHHRHHHHITRVTKPDLVNEPEYNLSQNFCCQIGIIEKIIIIIIIATSTSPSISLRQWKFTRKPVSCHHHYQLICSCYRHCNSTMQWSAR